MKQVLIEGGGVDNETGMKEGGVDSVVDMYKMFSGTDSFNIDLSSWIVSSVTNMDRMFFQAYAYTQTLCGNTWVESTASKDSMFFCDLNY